MLSTACACTKLRRSARVISTLYDDALGPTGLTVAQFAMLRTLGRIGPSSLTQYAAATGHDRSTLNRTIRPLEQAGYLESSGGRDQRARIVEVTDAGRVAVRRAEPLWATAQEKIEAALGADYPALFAMLDKVEELRG
jgi:DNA-binding MarR family transcriptional regulator